MGNLANLAHLYKAEGMPTSRPGSRHKKKLLQGVRGSECLLGALPTQVTYPMHHTKQDHAYTRKTRPTATFVYNTHQHAVSRLSSSELLSMNYKCMLDI